MDDISFQEALDRFFTKSYMAEINNVLVTYPKKRSINIDWKELEKFDAELADAVMEHPTLAIKGGEAAIRKMNLHNATGEEFRPHVRFYNCPDKDLLIENIGSHFLNKLFVFKGLITRRGDVIHKAKRMVFECPACAERFPLIVDRNFSTPGKCPTCKKAFLRARLDEATFVDYQVAEVQDPLERVTAGTPAAKIIINLEDDLVNTIIPGENVEITGILRINPSKKYNKGDMIFQKYVEVTHVKKIQRDFEELEITKEEEEEILNLASDPEIVSKIRDSVAPDIHGYDEIKLALALQLFGGRKGKTTPGGMPIRDDIHILLVGDPGIAKTRFLRQMCEIAPKSVYVSGKSVSGVGLTASAEKDELSGGGWTLKAGALVLASGGVAAIDEFDKIDDEDRASLHEVMESGTVSIAKAGIVATFKAKTTIVAAANPKLGRFLKNRNIPDQFNIPPSLLSRFDLIFPLLDELNETKDERLAEHILKMHSSTHEEKEGEGSRRAISKELLRKYIAYAKSHISPVLSIEASKVLKDYYVSLRRLGEQTGSVPITPRYLEGLIRMAEAHAKARLSSVVEEVDAEAAKMLLNYVISEIMTDKETNIISTDIIASGRSPGEMKIAAEIIDIIKSISANVDVVEIDAVVQEAVQNGMDEYKVRRTISKMLKNGDLYEPRPGILRLLE
ncbi:MAG: hypothetical protein D6769_02935 [Methanobacteriota archaeon]|nr:MAG: hypothetical protein D6769_02935 [Euryarchaeota archaeon]